VSTNIPFLALNNGKIKKKKKKKNLEVNCCRSIPDESTLKKKYLSKCCNNILEIIRNKVHGTIFVSVDETCDTLARCLANVIIGTLEIDGPGEVFLLATEVLNPLISPQFVNSSTGRCFCRD
jgi:hypothetical protein